MFEIMNNTNKENSFTNKTLASATRQIYRLGEDVKKSMFKISLIVADVDGKKAYKDDGFKDTISWVRETFGFKKSQAYDLLKVGRLWVNPETKESVLPHTDTDFSMSQVQVLLPLDVETAKELTEQGEITVDMTVKELRETVKKMTGDEPDTTEEGQETSPTEEETQTEPSTELLEETGTSARELVLKSVKQSASLMKVLAEEHDIGIAWEFRQICIEFLKRNFTAEEMADVL